MSEELTRFVESYSSDSMYIKKAEPVSLKEALQKLPLELRESTGDSAESWWVPISYYEKVNKNNRNQEKRVPPGMSVQIYSGISEILTYWMRT